MTTCFGKSCSFGLTVRVFRGRWLNFVSVPLSLLVLRVGCGMQLYSFLIIAFLFTLYKESDVLLFILSPTEVADLGISCCVMTGYVMI